ncbi:MAG: endo alpha-1,4 polygalactosaminidase [Proteocatella sp.]
MRKSLVLLIVACTILVMGITGCSENSKEFKNEYGVFLSLDNKNLDVFKDYRVIVIDAAYFEKEDIIKLKKQGHVVYTYLNIGSIETFREYYDDFKDITIGDYENWDEEKWIDVSNEKWQKFLIKDLASNYQKKGVDGFFVDNIDVPELFISFLYKCGAPHNITIIAI